MHKKQFALGGVRRLERVVHVVLIHRALEGRVHQDHVVFALLVEFFRKRILIEELGRLDAVQHQVHRADAQHGHARIVIEAAQELRAA